MATTKKLIIVGTVLLLVALMLGVEWGSAEWYRVLNAATEGAIGAGGLFVIGYILIKLASVFSSNDNPTKPTASTTKIVKPTEIKPIHYEKAQKEWDTGKTHKGLLAKTKALSDGNKDKQEALYLKSNPKQNYIGDNPFHRIFQILFCLSVAYVVIALTIVPLKLNIGLKSVGRLELSEIIQLILVLCFSCLLPILIVSGYRGLIFIIYGSRVDCSFRTFWRIALLALIPSLVCFLLVLFNI